ncbi:serine--tRNA ligase [Acidiferrobacter sp.]|uniref:serine--tRNA ligase n=1 Tax=Acidiferrobacter sp. TaxID=1872107 RepID=UPI00260717B5|nr:serine--tRNA ligase [Acidiferrobacter sp.]
MIDPRFLRNQPEEAARLLARRGFTLDIEALKVLEARRKVAQKETEDRQASRNARAKAIGGAKARGEDVSALMAGQDEDAQRLAAAQAELACVQAAWDELASALPNIPAEDVPDGRSEEDNVEVRRWGDPFAFAFAPRDHVDLGEGLKGLDLTAAAKLAGSRFAVLRGPLARLQRALIQFMLDLHTREHGYTEVYVPYMANRESLFGTGQLPKFAEDLFAIAGLPYFLIPTAEVPVTNLARDMVYAKDELPQRFVCHTPCFRSEAGAAGRDTRGLIRQHQFEKVELVQIVAAGDSVRTHEELTWHAETVLQRLKLPYRVMALCAGDMGFASAKTYDIEVYLPGSGRYREISSCSNFRDFQARRLNARARAPGQKPELVHTLNGSGLAVGRTLVAVLENYQQADGSVRIPDALVPYMGGETRLAPPL